MLSGQPQTSLPTTPTLATPLSLCKASSTGEGSTWCEDRDRCRLRIRPTPPAHRACETRRLKEQSVSCSVFAACGAHLDCFDSKTASSCCLPATIRAFTSATPSSLLSPWIPFTVGHETRWPSTVGWSSNFLQPQRVEGALNVSTQQGREKSLDRDGDEEFYPSLAARVTAGVIAWQTWTSWKAGRLWGGSPNVCSAPAPRPIPARRL